MAYSDSDPRTADLGSSHEASGPPSRARHRSRTDLKVLRDSDPTSTTSDVTIINTQSGDRHVLTSDEFSLFCLADGANTLADIRLAFKAQTGREVSHGKLFTLFRRFRSLGLLEGDVAESSEPGPAISGDMPRKEKLDAGETGSPATAQHEATTILEPSRGRGPFPTATPNATDVQNAGVANPAGSPAPSGEAAILPVEQLDPASPDDEDSARRARLKRVIRSRRRGAASVAAAGRAKQAPEILPAAAPSDRGDTSPETGAVGGSGILKNHENPEPSELGNREESGPESRSRIRRKQRGAGGAKTHEIKGTGRPANRGADVDDELMAALEEEMGAGALGPMLGGRALGGGVQNFLAGVARARGRQSAETGDKEPARISLFNSDTFFKLLAVFARPLKYFFVPLLLLVPISLWIAWAQRETLTQDIRAFDVSVVGTVILAVVIANLVCRLTQATFIRGFGGTVKQFGIVLSFGIPRFFADLGGIATLDRRRQLWVHAAPLIARLGLFCGGTLLWFALRQSAPWPADLAFLLGQVGLLAVLLSALPLLPSDGYRWLATYFGRPALRSDVLESMPGRQSDVAEESDTAITGNADSAVTFYVLATALALSLLAVLAQAYFDVATSGDIQALTVATLLGLGVALAVWLVALWKVRRRFEQDDLEPAAAQQLLTTWTGTPDIAVNRPVNVGTIGKVFWAVIACALLAVAFLPYRYNPSGAFEILPTARTVVTARTSGEIEQVLVHEGDWIKANQALAKLSSDDQQREINITRAELDRAKAQLAQFGAKSAAPAAGGDPGMDALNRSIADAFSNEPAAGDANGDAAATNYTKTEAERAARAEVERLTRKLAYARDQLANTTIRAPKEGRVVTPNVHLLTGTWLRKGAELLSLVDTGTLEAQIDVPEADIGEVKVGNKVRLRPWSNDDREIVGSVTEIAPAAQARPYGTVVRVRAFIPNDAASLRPAMTGYAKIDGEDIRVWEAFLGRIVRIFRVEFWSWIP